MKIKHKIGKVYWEDAQSLLKYEEPPERCPIMISIGVVYKEKRYIRVASLLTPDGYNGVSTIIPLGCIKRIEWI